MERKKVLLVDDQRFARQLLRDVLAPSGFIIDDAQDGNEAFSKAIEFQPDIILMDMVMPGLCGVDVCRMLKADSRTRAIPIIVITANKNKENLVDAFEAGADDYITKPFSYHELKARIYSNMIKGDAIKLLEQKAGDTKTLLDISQAVNSSLNSAEILQSIVTIIAGTMEVTRCSITRIDEGEGCGYVLASSDAPDIGGFRIDLQRYPEIREVVRTGQALVVEDLKTHPLMEGVRKKVVGLGFNTILVLPVIYRSEVIGTLMLRTLRAENAFTPRERNLCQLIANVSASALKNAHRFEKVQEESRELMEVKDCLERELREKEIFETLFEHASEGLMVLNVLGEPEYINDSAIEILGTTRDIALKSTFANFLAEESCTEALENHINFFLGKEYRQKFDLLVKTAGGETRCVSFSISSHRLRGDFAILALNDVTAERTAQHRMKEAHARLQELDRLKSDFIKTAAQELRAPVTLLQSYCAHLTEEGPENVSASQRYAITGITDTCARLSTLVGQMLDLNRLESRADALKIAPSRILDPISEVVAMLLPRAALKGQEIVVEPFPETIMAEFDRETIQRVLANLLDNAITSTPAGGRIAISVSHADDSVLVSVTDSGAGIPETHRGRIFDEFSQIPIAGADQEGTGLELAICKRIIDAHNGRIWVDCHAEGGSRFTFSLPAMPS